METPVAQIAAQSEHAEAPQLPHNIEAEQGLLGALLINNDALEQISDFLLARHFFDPVHARIYEAVSKLINNGNLASPVTLKTYLDHDDGLATLGGAGYLARLASNATTIANARQYGRTIYDLAVRRELITVGEEMIADRLKPKLTKTRPRSSTRPSNRSMKSPKRGRIVRALCL